MLVDFVFRTGRFAHGPSSHVAGRLRQAGALMLVTPWIRLCTYPLFPFAVWQRVAPTAITLVFLGVLAPLQYACRVALVVTSGPTIVPVLDLVGGVMLPILGLVACCGWAMSRHEPLSRPPVAATG